MRDYYEYNSNYAGSGNYVEGHAWNFRGIGCYYGFRLDYGEAGSKEAGKEGLIVFI